MPDDGNNTWIVIQGAESIYDDSHGRRYEYPAHIPNARQMSTQDTVIPVLRAKDAPDGRRILGVGSIARIEPSATEGRLVAIYEDWQPFDPPLTFDAIGGDPRNNRTNSIVRVDPVIAGRLMAFVGVSKSYPSPQPGGRVSSPTQPPSDSELRQKLHDAVALDLLGPAGGPEEELLELGPRNRYLVGMLAPKGTGLVPEEIDTADREEGVSAEEGSNDRDTLGSESLSPSSVGLSFCVDETVSELRVRASWGQYERVESEEHLTDEGSGKRVWRRRPAGGELTLRLTTGDRIIGAPDDEQPEVTLRAIVRDPENGHRIVTVFLVNGQTEPEKNKDAAWLFQPEIVIDAGGEPVFVKRSRAPFVEGSDAEARELAALDMLYRLRPEFAVGHGIAVHAEVDTDDATRATRLSTRVMPWHDVPVTESASAADWPALEGLELDMKVLSELERDDLVSSLRNLPGAYAEWIAARRVEIARSELAGHDDAADMALERCEEVRDRITEGIEVLAADDDALEAFRFANRVMYLQRKHGLFAEKKRRGQEASLEDSEPAQYHSWRAFQLGFLLMTLPSVTDLHHPHRSDPGASIADLLWFPTGGGKTEAYFGVAAYVMALRRLHGTVGGFDGQHGLAVIMRYTLRLLTVQQFQRASALMCAMEVVRKERINAGEGRYGDEPFRLGLWVGQRTTPNRTKDAAAAINDERGNSWGSGVASPKQLTACPWCGCEIKASRDIDVRGYPGDVSRTLTYCSDKRGRCPFTRAKAAGEGLPVVVVDEEIYRRLPAMLIATVDKFAQMPWKGEVQTLFGRVVGRCLRHGFLSPDDADTGRHTATRGGRFPRVEPVDSPPLRPPDLIIQDELHLISGPLGTMVGLYETAVDELCSWDVDGRKVKPKIIASTATIRRAPEQVHAVFARRVQVFPPHGLTIGDDFFSLQRSTADIPGRRYLGVCAPGKSRAAVLIRVYTSFVTAAQALYDDWGEVADPWMTVVGYFNSLRELGGMRRLVEDDVTTRALRMERSELERPGLAKRVIRVVEELTSRKASTEIPEILDRLEKVFPPPGVKPDMRPIDVVLATNMLSVGVDVQRLGLMIVNGQPKTTAEYIQSTSRVGRGRPGLVCTVLNWARPRDFSHYETFEHYHDTFYRHVEAQSVTPFAPRAIDRGLTGVLASLVRLDGLELDPNEAAASFPGGGNSEIQEARDAITDRAWTITDDTAVRDRVMAMAKQREDEWSKEASVGGRSLVYRRRRGGDGTQVGLLKSPGRDRWQMFTTLTSMREVEPSVALILRQRDPGAEPEWSVRTEDEEGEES